MCVCAYVRICAYVCVALRWVNAFLVGTVVCVHACMYVCMYVCRTGQGRSIVGFRVHGTECVALMRANEPETHAASPATLHVIAAQGMQRVSATLCLVYVDACMCVLVLVRVRVRVRVRACVEVCMALLPRCCLHLFPSAEPLPHGHCHSMSSVTKCAGRKAARRDHHGPCAFAGGSTWWRRGHIVPARGRRLDRIHNSLLECTMCHSTLGRQCPM